MSLIGSIFFAFGQITLFATLYVFGVVISLIGTGFLIGSFVRFFGGGRVYILDQDISRWLTFDLIWGFKVSRIS